MADQSTTLRRLFGYSRPYRGRMMWALAGMIVNVFLAAAKVTAGLLGNSYVLIADGIESVLDIGGSAVIWGGLKFASRPPDATHPYGHGKAEPLAAGIVAVGVLLAAADTIMGRSASLAVAGPGFTAFVTWLGAITFVAALVLFYVLVSRAPTATTSTRG